MKLTYRLLAFVALMLVVNVRVQAQQKGESRFDKLVREHGGSHEEHDRACHEAIQAAVSKKHNINPYSHHYVGKVECCWKEAEAERGDTAAVLLSVDGRKEPSVHKATGVTG